MEVQIWFVKNVKSPQKGELFDAINKNGSLYNSF